MKLFRPILRSLPSSSRYISHSALPPRLRASCAFTTALNSRIPRTPAATRNSFHSTSRHLESTAAEFPSSTPATTSDPASSAQSPDPSTPSYNITFTCRPCGTRSTHRLSKQAYHYGAVLIKCPGCSNRHVMADHLGIFTNKGQGGTLEDIIRMYGKGDGPGTLKKGYIEGDMEFWDDGTVQKRKQEEEQSMNASPKPDTRSIDLGNRK